MLDFATFYSICWVTSQVYICSISPDESTQISECYCNSKSGRPILLSQFHVGRAMRYRLIDSPLTIHRSDGDYFCKSTTVQADWNGLYHGIEQNAGALPAGDVYCSRWRSPGFSFSILFLF